ncbi:MAG: hypothetical protein HRU00_12320 [Myxococcales bacterium]|nr:hypothetical protein [Myxococcales bacterium]
MAVVGPTKMLVKLFSTLAPSGDMGGGQTAEFNVDEAWPTGTGARQGDKPFDDTRTLAASTGEDLDLQALLDGNAAALSLAEVAAIAIKSAEANGGDLHVAPSVGTPWVSLLQAGSVMVLPPGGFAVFGCTSDPAWAVAAGNKSFNVANQDGGASASYQVWLIGKSV